MIMRATPRWTGSAVSVTAGELEILKADPLLVVTIVDADTEAPKAYAPATETDKTAAKADKKAG